MTKHSITVAGAGVLGLWQALTLARMGHRVRLIEASAEPFIAGASRYAGAMLAPDCEAEAAPAIVRDLGTEGLAQWRAVYPGVINAGTLVVAAARDQSELKRFANSTRGHRTLAAPEIESLEPDLSGRFSSALFFADEAHMDAQAALQFLLDAVRASGVEICLGKEWPHELRAGQDEIAVDCRGLAARDELAALRGVRGERLLIRTDEIRLSRPVRLLHPRHPLYIVPSSGGRFIVGATMIESEDAGPMTVRSALELLGAAYALHPAFGEAEIIDMGAGVRPAFPDNVPRAVVRENGRHILVNGAYRHGFLLAPLLATAVADYIATKRATALLTVESMAQTLV